MKTKLCFTLLLVVGIIHAQDNYMSLSFGVANPLGNHANTESLATDGFAISGFMADYSGAYYPIDYLGIGGSVKFNQNGIDKEKTTDALLELLPDDPGINVGEPVLDLGLWRIVSVGAGPHITLPAGKLSFDMFFNPGLHVVMPPQMAISTVIDDEPIKYSLNSQNLRFGFDTGIAIRYKMNETSGLRLSAGYLQTSTSGEIVSSIAGQADNTEVDFSKKIQLFNIGFGIVYYL